MTDNQQVIMAHLESRYFGAPQPIARSQTPEGIAERRGEAARQLYLASQSDRPEVKALATSQFILSSRMDTPHGVSVQTVGRNSPCPCGSGNKSKWCCL